MELKEHITMSAPAFWMQLMWWKMERWSWKTDLDLNGKRLLNYNLKSKTVIFGKYDRVNVW